MAMLRVSSYRKLFEDDGWSRTGGLSVQCAGQYRAAVRVAAVDECDCDKLDFVAAKELNKEGLTRFVQDRTIIAALNNRLVRLIELAHCFEEENESLECQIVDLEEKLNNRQASSGITSAVAKPDYSLDAVVERLRRQRDEILCRTEELQKELERLMKEYEKAAQQRILLQQGRQHVAEEVDAVAAECLALREQVAIYEEQLANMEAQHTTEVESLLEPAEGTAGAVAAIKFGSPDITPALDVKEYYCQLAESLQYQCGAASSAVVRHGDGKQLEVGGAAGSAVKDLSEIKDVGEMKMLISELEKELAELEKCNEELEDEVEMKKAAYMDEIAELECTIDEMRHQEADFQLQMKEQCEDYKELLNENMARDMEITAYRSLVENEEERLYCL
ncbi:neurofilament medium polypeptide [Plectropomus leopardus]|uniref:neurofilament medium polypeptide n=1 Tax=Plectropomus leopardus TaxID=160734 RepID=UPI001C4C2642|nr:neurofilament medium polypeptide [Plectropomus leopardus]